MSASSMNLRALREALATGVLSPKLAKLVELLNGNTNRNTFL
jgi:hypothetical protein